jgi:hypothetical protein
MKKNGKHGSQPCGMESSLAGNKLALDFTYLSHLSSNPFTNDFSRITESYFENV